jgi:hypothetical protein
MQMKGEKALYHQAKFILIKIKRNLGFRLEHLNRVKLWMNINSEVIAEEIQELNFTSQIKINNTRKIILFKTTIIT